MASAGQAFIVKGVMSKDIMVETVTGHPFLLWNLLVGIASFDGTRGYHGAGEFVP